jgi:hypothetical protein
MEIGYCEETGPGLFRPPLTEDFNMIRRILVLGVLGCSLAVVQPARAQGVWFGGIGVPGFYASGFASAGFSGGLIPTRLGFPVVAAVVPPPVVIAPPVVVVPPVVSVARPIVYGGIGPVYVPRPAVRLPLDRAYRRAWRRGW